MNESYLSYNNMKFYFWKKPQENKIYYLSSNFFQINDMTGTYNKHTLFKMWNIINSQLINLKKFPLYFENSIF